ncbi:hypothetical protein R6Q57_025908 [Mikania cordata]
MIRDALIRYIHRCIVTTISGRGQRQEWAGHATWDGVSRCTMPPSTTDGSAVHCGVTPLSPTLPAPEAWLTCLMICRAAWEARVERRLDRLEDLVQWTVASEHARRDGSQLPPFPEPRVYADDGSSAGPSGS